MVSNIRFGWAPISRNLPIECRDELRPYIESVRETVTSLLVAGPNGQGLEREQIETLRELPNVYPSDEAPLVAEAVEVLLRAQLGFMYDLINPDVILLPETPENCKRVLEQDNR